MSDPPASATAWPAARPTGISPIRHPAWEAARNAILDLAAEGPCTAIIVGEPGTGKTWLLRELASALGDHGFPTMLLMQGNLPMVLSSGAALLVDDASLMERSARAQMLAQQHGVVILAGAEWFEGETDPALPAPAIIRLRVLASSEIADFAGEWLRRAGMPDTTVDASMVARLTSGSGGRVGTIVRLLTESAAAPQSPPISAESEIESAFVPDRAVEPAPASLTPPRRRKAYPLLLGGTAIAASIALGWALMPARFAQPEVAPPILAEAIPAAAPFSPLPDANPPQPAPSVVTAESASAPALPPLQDAATTGPALVTAAAPAQPTPSAPPLVVPPPPEMNVANGPVTIASATVPAAAASTLPSMLPPAEPALVATLNDAEPTKPLAPPLPTRTGGPGLALIAHRGDTLQSLYGNIYRDRNAPPFATVLAANPGPLKPGAIVVFPEPPGGWQRVQR